MSALIIREVETAAVEVTPPAAAGSTPVGGHRRRRRWTRNAVAGVCVVGLGLAALAALQRATDTHQPATHGAGFVSFTDPAQHYRISYPGAWQRTTDGEGGLVLHAGGRAAVNVREFTLAAAVNPQNIADMRAVTDAILGTPDAHLSVLGSQQVKVGRLPGMYYLYTFPAGDQRGVHAHYFLFDGKQMFTLVFQAVPATNFEALAPTFDAVADTFSATRG